MNKSWRKLDLGRINQEKEPSFDLYFYMRIQYKKGSGN